MKNEPDRPTPATEKKKHRKRRLPKIYWGYLVLLTGSLALMTVYAMQDEEKEITVELRKMVLQHPTPSSAEVLSSANTDSTQLTADGADTTQQTPVWADTATVIKEKQYHYNIVADNEGDTNSSGERFLLIGDSMNEFLRLRLNDYCIANGHKMECVIWYGATTKQYGTCDTIAHFIRKYRPTYVLLTIGANELFIKDIITKRTPYVQHIINQLGNIPYVWIGPPNWKNDTGINELILTHVGQSRYFESKKLSFKRCSDGAHPTKSSAFNWMDEIAHFLANDALHYIAMNDPDTLYNKTPHTTILKMVR